MRKVPTKFWLCLPCLLGFPLVLPVYAAHDEPIPSAATIIQKSVAVNNADWKAQPRYAYRDLDIKSKIDSDGRTKVQQSRTHEVMLIEGSPYLRLVAVNNEPLSPSQELQETIKMNREIARRQGESRSEQQARVAKYRNERADEHLLMQQMVDAFHFRFVRDEEVDGVDCYLLEATPDPDYRPPVEKARVLTGMRGHLWIDKQNYHWVKVQAEVIQPVEFGFFVARVKPGTKFELDQQPVGNIWLPKRFIQTVNASIFGLYGLRTKEEELFSDYHENTLRAQAQTPVN